MTIHNNNNNNNVDAYDSPYASTNERTRNMKTKVIVSLILTIVLLGSFAFSASAQTDSYTVVNGGSSVSGSNDVKLGATGTNWSVHIDSYSFNGLPSQIFGDNVIVTRMRTAGGAYASNTCTYRSTNCSTTYFKAYYSGYGNYGDSYSLYVSMSSGPSTGGTLSITWQA